MKIISFLNGKGGVGKTTLSINVAACLVRMGFGVCVVDTDPQGSVSNWFNPDTCPFDVVEASTEKEIYSISKKLTDYDYVVVDGAAIVSAISAAVSIVADLVLIPVGPSPLDFSASGGVVDVIEARSRLKPLVARFLVSRKVAGATMVKTLENAIQATGLATMKTGTTYRQSYSRSLLNGGTIYDTKDGKAKGEIDNITREIMELVA